MFVFRLTIRKLPVELTSETGQTGPEFDTLSLVSILSSNVRWVKSRTGTTGCVKSAFPICTEALRPQKGDPGMERMTALPTVFPALWHRC